MRRSPAILSLATYSDMIETVEACACKNKKIKSIMMFIILLLLEMLMLFDLSPALGGAQPYFCVDLPFSTSPFPTLLLLLRNATVFGSFCTLPILSLCCF